MKKEPKDRLEGGLLKERDEKRKRALEERNREAKRILAEEEAKDRAWRERVLLQRQQDAAADANRVYEQSWKRFEQSCNLCLSFTDVPFPVKEGKEGDLARVVFHHTPLSEHKKLLRKEVLRWHPDKFLQKWGARLQGPDHRRILARVNEISQALHQLYSSL
jgi:NF-kappa-B inhibitor-like protein 1